jgi:hypothetical protein
MERHLHVMLISSVFIVDDNGLPILNIDHDAISYRKGEAFPTSTCATPCTMHQVKIQVGSSGYAGLKLNQTRLKTIKNLNKVHCAVSETD